MAHKKAAELTFQQHMADFLVCEHKTYPETQET
jgi:hypothetical protein